MVIVMEPLNIESSGTNDILIKSNSDGANHGDVEIKTVEGGRSLSYWYWWCRNLSY